MVLHESQKKEGFKKHGRGKEQGEMTAAFQLLIYYREQIRARVLSAVSIFLNAALFYVLHV